MNGEVRSEAVMVNGGGVGGLVGKSRIGGEVSKRIIILQASIIVVWQRERMG